MDDDTSPAFTWSGPKSTWTEQDWANYRSMPWWLQRPVDLFSMIASLVNRMKRSADTTGRR